MMMTMMMMVMMVMVMMITLIFAQLYQEGSMPSVVV